MIFPPPDPIPDRVRAHHPDPVPAQLCVPQADRRPSQSERRHLHVHVQLVLCALVQPETACAQGVGRHTKQQ